MTFNDTYLNVMRKYQPKIVKKDADGELEGFEKQINQSDFAFRKDALRALNLEDKIQKKVDLHYYLEDLRSKADENLDDFYFDLDPKTEPPNIKLMYYYYLGSKGLQDEMMKEAISE